MNQQRVLSFAAILGALAVSIGAFGAHAFKPMLVAAGRLDTYELAVRYQFYHTLALLVVGLLMSQYLSKKLVYASVLFLVGIVFFSGSLYLLCFTGKPLLGAVTPIGGVFLIAGWIFLLLGIVEKQ